MDRPGRGRRSPERAVEVRWWQPRPLGAAIGLLLAGFATTPSLLPRAPVTQGLVAGGAFAVGYLLALAVTGLLRPVLPRWRGTWQRVAWLVLLVAAVVVAIPVGRAGVQAQDEQRAVVGDAPWVGTDVAVAWAVGVGTAVLGALAGHGLLAAHRALRARRVRRLGAGDGTRRRAAAWSVGVLGGSVVGVVVLVVLGFAAYTELSYRAYNASVVPGQAEPDGTHRSGGGASALSWELTGHEGRRILAGGPRAADIEAVTGAPSLDPIRVYVGVEEPGGWADHAAAAVAELDRLRAQDREVLVVAGTTGTGWLDPVAVDAVEYLHHGDTALVAMQYSVGESWHSFVFHPGAYAASTRALVTAVHDWWSQLPEDERPRLYLYGLSLGSRAVQDSFTDAADLRAYGDGVLLAGTPFGTAINAELTARRDEGSPVVVPVLDGGREVRWFAEALDVAETGGRWDDPRVVYLQHGTDPIVWVGPDILWRPPEWLEADQRSAQVHPDMRWYPVVTALQAMADTAVDLAGPDGVGHRYGVAATEGWIQVAGDGGNSPEVLDAIRLVLLGGELPAGSDV